MANLKRMEKLSKKPYLNPIKLNYLYLIYVGIFFLCSEAQNSVRLGDLSEAEKMKNLSDQFELLNEAFK